MAVELAIGNSPRLFSFPCGQKKTGGEKENSLRLAVESGGLRNRNTMIYALVFYIRWALRPAVLVRLTVNLTKGERNSALRADDIRPYGGIGRFHHHCKG